MSNHFKQAVSCVLIILFVLSGLPAYAQPDTPHEFVPGRCPVTFRGLDDVECGMVTVPQDRVHPEERSVKLAVAVFKAQAETPLPDPLIFLDGGPGSRTLDSFAGGFGSLLTAINRDRDVIIFDYRGIGYSDPALTCPERAGAVDDSWIAACRAQLETQGVDVTDFTTRDNASDAADIVRALGYETYNIWGGSYGSSVAMTLLRDHPEHIRAALVTALQPPQGDLRAETPVGLIRALDGVSALCQADDVCSLAFPGNLTEQLVAVVERLNAHPAAITGATRELTSLDLLVGLSEILKDEKNSLMVPGLMAALYAEQYDVAAPMVGAANLPGDPLFPVGAWLSMRCTDSILVPASDATSEMAQTVPSIIRDSVAAGYDMQTAWCTAWGARVPTEADRLPAITDTPVLIISGALDPFSSQEWLASTLATLPNGHGFMLPYYMHHVVHDPCALDMLLSFMTDPTSEPDSSCIAQMAPPAFSLE